MRSIKPLPKRLISYVRQNLHLYRVKPEAHKAAAAERVQIVADTEGKVTFRSVAPTGYYAPFDYLSSSAAYIWSKVRIKPEACTPEAIKGISSCIYSALQYTYETEAETVNEDASAYEAFLEFISGAYWPSGNPFKV